MTPPPVTNFRYQHQWRDGRIVKVPINSKGRSMEFTTKANDRVTRDPLDFGRMKGRAELDRLE